MILRMAKEDVKNLIFYLLLLLGFGSLMYGIVTLGSEFDATGQTASVANAHSDVSGFNRFIVMLQDSINHPLSILLLQIITILLVARLFGWICTKINQPTVIGEILAGIVLGPSVLAKIFPEISAFLFAPESLNNITILSQVGLILFMFAIGMELDIVEVKRKLKETILISHTSTIVPFFFGMVTAYCVYPSYTDGSVPFISFALFVGIAMSITAFPVLARIIHEKGMAKSHLGTLALASAANGDITAWCVLAVVIAIAQAGTIISAIYTILFTIIYILFMFYVVRPFMNIIGNLYHNKEVINKAFVTFIFIVLIISSYLTEILGIHALFGAFIAGVVMPNNLKFRQIMTDKVEDVALSLLLPLFFVSTGLRTEIGLLNTPELWGMCAIFILVAIAGKFGGAAFSARFVGESWQNSLRMGALMNTRGLMELVVLSIGYEMGILPPSVFVMLVLMTIVTTFMTSPLIAFIDYCFEAGKRIKARINTQKDAVYKLLLSFGRAGSGAIMLKVAQQLFGYGKRPLQVTALHMTEGTDINPLHIEDIKAISFDPIEEEARNLHMNIQTRYEISNNTTADIVNIVNNEEFDFLLIGSGVMLSDHPTDKEVMRHKHNFIMERIFGRLKPSESVLFGDFLRDKTQEFVEKARCSVGVFVNRNFTTLSNLLVIMYGTEDSFLLYNIERLVRKDNLAITLIDPDKVIIQNKTMMDTLNRIELTTKRFRFISGQTITPDLFVRYDFMLIGSHSWQKLIAQGEKMISKIPSSLVVYNYVPKNKKES